MLERYPPVNITPEEYEQQVVSWLRQEEKLQSFQVQHREKLVGLAGEYTFDGVARFNAIGGAEFVVLIEWDVSRGSWKKNGALHSVIRVSDQAATSACLRTSLRRW